MATNLSRRDFLFYGGATVAGVTLGQLGRRQLAKADALANTWHASAPERWATSVCRACPAACGVRVRLVNDVPVKLEGNPLCPISRGRLCAKGQAAIEAYFDPDRLVGPARRVGGGRNGGWERIEWDTAVAMLATKLRGARAGDVLAVSAEEHGPIANAWSTFWKTAGARLAWTPSATAPRLRAGLRAMTGVDANPMFDLEHATYVLSFGAPIVEDWLSPVWSQRSYSRFRRGSPQTRGRLVQIDARRSMTARKADEWFAVPADRQAILAYGIAAILLREGRTTRDAFESGGNVREFEQTVAARYMADEVAAATGVPVVTLLRLARDLVATPQPLVAVAADADPALVGAVMSLNSLIGAIDRPGGVFAALTTAASEAVALGAAAAQPASVVALRDASILRSLETPAALRDRIEHAGFVVSFSPYLDEAAEFADLLMPVHTPLESWHAVLPPPAIAGEQIAIARPAAAARLQTRDTGELLKSIAAAMGGAAAAACGWNSSADLVSTEIARLARERRGSPYTTQFGTDWVGQLEHGGWWLPASAPDRFEPTVIDAGGWLDPGFEPGQLTNALQARGGPVLAIPSSGGASEEAEPPAPAGYPLQAIAFTPAVVDLLGSQNQPSLFELLGQPDGAPWQPWIEMSPETARASGIEGGAPVRVTSPHGAVEAIAVLAEGTGTASIAIAHVPVVPGGGRWARTATADVRHLWPPSGPATGSVPVRITKV